MTNYGTVYLVGSGPGETSLITLKGMGLLREADAIVGDVLGHAILLQSARPDAEIHDVGCRTAQNKRPQTEINELLISLAQQGKMVVRLWPGDGFIFGRAAQEMGALRRAGLRAIFVPGITSAIAAPAYAGVPVTHWDHATSFAVVTAYASKNPQVRPDWAALARMETLVILMPLANLPELVERLLAEGCREDTPALAVQQGSLPQQKQVIATVGTLVDAVTAKGISHPAIVVVGNVVRLADELQWFQPEKGEFPLLGKRVLVTRPSHQAAELTAQVRALGGEPIPFPTIKICQAENPAPLEAAIQQLAAGHYHWLVFTSVNGVATFWQRLENVGYDSRALASARIAAIGPATAEALHRRSIRPDMVPETYTAEGVLAAFDRQGDIAGQRILLARADIARKTLPEGLRKRGATVDDVTAYRTVPISAGPRPPVAELVTFTSPSTVQGYVNCLDGCPASEALEESLVVCIGPVTADAARTLGVPVAAVAKEYTIAGLLDVLGDVGTLMGVGY